MDRKKMELVSEKLMLRVNDQVMKNLEKEYETISKQIKSMQNIKTTKVEPLSRVHEEVTSFLREDEHIGPHLENSAAMINAPESENGYFVVSKVVGNEK